MALGGAEQMANFKYESSDTKANSEVDPDKETLKNYVQVLLRDCAVK